MATKVCFKCQQEKSLDEFYAHPMMGDGHLGKCKECTKKDVSENYRAKRPQYARYERERFQRPERKRRVLEYQHRRRSRHPERRKAHAEVNNAIRDGRLIRQPCAVCGNPKSEAHHWDYSKPLDVIWLCRKHHLEEHGKVAYEDSAHFSLDK